MFARGGDLTMLRTLVIASIMMVLPLQASAAPDPLDSTRADIQKAVETVFRNQSVDSLAELGMSVGGVPNWEMLLAAKSQLEKKWKDIGQPDQYEVMVTP